MDAISDFLRKLTGVMEVERIADEARRKIGEFEIRYERSAFLPILNVGVREVLARDEVWVILKDRHFRKPPRPSVYMVEEVKEKNPPKEQILTVGGRTFRILGEEVMEEGSELPADARPLGEGFVFFPPRRSDPKLPCFFLVPPIPFGELDEEGDRLSIARVVSVSPSTLTDQFIRDALGFPQDDEYATVLIGFDNT
jgi:hypothetical protein